ncbi:MAG: aspartate carbamoyltransferase regulatory subunit [Candidatus Cloacimonetes bacterium]|nr:aspartate carbamoyltransferase regulatory subunit [Candidatus Cloacimonadota bacterium]MCF7812886.1 aspartate carbamoyltransferase regulatory subunit [Candidatus Cloacimonadota bacterium]MCF7867098.1 aspartate carbamoyltransferase regulatory subunit [Candidatus Cloacimonadota bacterium]MCF7882582.1 aspartate carbamoyltransferase regulatory subunit [Candidatus Cloacimonadota bacterium]
MSQVKQIKVNAIKNGTVIDHITAGKIRKVLDILHLEGNEVVMVGMNLFSNKIGRKDIVKIENKELSEFEVNSIALIAPEATLIIIKDFEVAKKAHLQLPEHIEDIINCPNPKCITNSEPIISKFKLTDDQTSQVRCLYCEKKYLIDEVKIKK